MGKRIVIALGGNALGKNLPEQMQAVKETSKAIVDLIELAVILKNSAHVVQHPHDGFAHRGGMVFRSCRCAPFLLIGVI